MINWHYKQNDVKLYYY